jgi:hypothetical protein
VASLNLVRVDTAVRRGEELDKAQVANSVKRRAPQAGAQRILWALSR